MGVVTNSSCRRCSGGGRGSGTNGEPWCGKAGDQWMVARVEGGRCDKSGGGGGRGGAAERKIRG
jgi:hypothetical protein